MKKVLKLQNLDCGHCAQEIEQEIAKIDGVNNVRVNFLGQRLTLDVDDDKFDTVFNEAKNIINIIEPDVTVINLG